MKLFGCAINFFGGPGESRHKYFLKYLGSNTQRQHKLFVQQSTENVCMRILLLSLHVKLTRKRIIHLNRLGMLLACLNTIASRILSILESTPCQCRVLVLMAHSKNKSSGTWTQAKINRNQKNHRLHPDLLCIVPQKLSQENG